MNPALWAGPVVVTAWLAALSLYARRRWVVLYLLTCFVGFAAGLVVWSWGEFARDLWWSFWAGYVLTLPLLRVVVPHWWEKRPADV